MIIAIGYCYRKVCLHAFNGSGVGPEHSFLMNIKKTQYNIATDKEAIEAFFQLSREEGIFPALEPAHALAYATKLAKTRDKKDIIVVTAKKINKY